MQSAAITPNFGIEIPKAEHVNEVFVFFAADQIPGYVKASNPDWNPGGLLRPDAITLKYRSGYIRKCEITAMRTQMVSEQATNVAPAQRGLMAPMYELTDGTTKRMIGRNPDGTHDGLLRMPFYPSMEVDRLTSQNDGLVKMPVSNFSEALEAQLFLFPNWSAILKDGVELPNKIADLRAYFATRLNDAKTPQQEAVARAAMKSCDDYRAWGNSATTSANATLREMQTKGVAWSYGLDAELAFAQLGLQRQDSLVQDQGNQLNVLTDAVTKLVQHQTGAAVHVPEPAPQVDQAELEAFLRWKAAQSLEPGTATKAPEPEPAETAPAEPIAPEPDKAEKVDDGIKIGSTVEWEGRTGEVIKNIFGHSFQVRFEDGFEQTVRRGELALR